MNVNFDEHPILPVIVLDDAERAIPVAEALLDGGIRIIEITFRTDAAAESISRIARSIPEMCVGAGTVVTREQAARAVDSGSQFGLAPGLDVHTVNTFMQHDLPFIPGVMTPTEIQRAFGLGCDRLKFFPAGAAGGEKMLKNLSAPVAHLGIKFCPTGGVNLDNLRGYLDMPQVFAVGGSWIATREGIAQGDWETITRNAREATEAAER